MTENEQISLFLATAHRCADESGSYLRDKFRSPLQIKEKQGKNFYDPVTEADQKAEEIIRTRLREEWPEHGIIGEEMAGERLETQYTWVLDPIDGTTAFLAGHPMWGTLIGLASSGEALLGMMNQPFTGERFWAVSGGPTYYRPPSIAQSNEPKRLNTSGCATLQDALITTTSPDYFATPSDLAKFDHLSQRCRTRRYGGDCYNYCLLAAGTIDLVVESGLNKYDIFPLIPIVQEAGGVITTWEGQEATEGGQVIASATPALHQAALEELNK